MTNPEPTKITWDDLNDRRVDDRLKEEATVSTTASHYATASVNAPQVAPPSLVRRALFNALVYLPLLGAVGGAVGWAAGEASVVRNDRVAEAARLHAELDDLDRADAQLKFVGHESDYQAAREQVERFSRDNRFFDPTRPPEPALLAADSRAIFRADLITLGAIGLAVGAALAAADALFGARWLATVGDGAIGALIGAAGVAATVVVVRAAHAGSIDDVDLLAPLVARIAGWTAIGAVVGVASGVASRSGRRAGIGLLGGALAGAAVGSTFHLLLSRTDAPHVRLIAAVSVGVASGVAIALIERVARHGWLRVTQGPIAGKQFILYRNPTLLGSTPTSHIYLFRDSAVGKRHAAVFRVEKSFEIENLPLGGPTLVNDQPITRARLRHGDEIRVGKSRFVFEERRQ